MMDWKLISPESSFKNGQTALLIGVYYATQEKDRCNQNLAELSSLCDTYGLRPLLCVPCPLKKIDPGVFLGRGKLEELLLKADALGADLICLDEEITPKQQQNLEKFFRRPVIDRTELIIEVFAKKAQTKEARLQVELAQVQYQLPRLKRMWTHLSRQSGSSGSGGGGYLRGEGELQIEIDRRILRKKVVQLKAAIQEIQQQRSTQRTKRTRTQIPTFAIVGYTNVGKSTLLNALTSSSVVAEDKLFATLDTTTRRLILPNRQEVVVVDTVGFIQKIPHTLVAAFKSTLEEAVHTDVLLHLIDVSHPMAQLQTETTKQLLRELHAQDRIITVWNKVDLCTDPTMLYELQKADPQAVSISARTGEGLDQLLQRMMVEISPLRKRVQLRIPQSQYGIVSELLAEGRVFECTYDQNDVLLDIEIPLPLEHKVKVFFYEPA